MGVSRVASVDNDNAGNDCGDTSATGAVLAVSNGIKILDGDKPSVCVFIGVGRDEL
jgi:hypothetical protein